MEFGMIKMWHGGEFKKLAEGVKYVGGQCKSMAVDTNKLCWFLLEEFATSCGYSPENNQIYYLEPHSENYENGLKRVYLDDAGLRMLSSIIVKGECADCYIVSAMDFDFLMSMQDEGSKANRKKLTPRRKKVEHVVRENVPHVQNPNVLSLTKTPLETIPTYPSQSQITQANPYTQWSVSLERPLSPILVHETWADICAFKAEHGFNLSDASSEDVGYEPDLDNGDDDDSVSSEVGEAHSVDEVPDELEDEGFREKLVGEDGDTDDDEFRDSRKKLQAWNAEALLVARKLEQTAVEGKLPGQDKLPVEAIVIEKEGEFLSEYEESADEIDTPDESEEDDIKKRRFRKKEVVVVNSKTDFHKLKWNVGIKFPNRKEFKEAVIRYGIAQGRNLTWVVSDKSRQQRLGVKCNPGCPFRLYGSWDNKRSMFVVKSVEDNHTCTRNMKANRQLKSTWLAEQLLEVFKGRPHWPAAEIVEMIKIAYKVLVKRGFAYKVKYYAHQLLHGSMRHHYGKLKAYIAALELASPNSYFKLELIESTNSPTFQRLFICFDGVKKGWFSGCRRVLCLDGCFLKTFLGGMLLSAIGRDSNEQMFPLAWAVVEGETNDSWAWFVSELKTALGEEDGTGWTIISDEHQGILNSVASVLPNAEHRHCARHIFAKWHRTFSGDEMKILFWSAAKAYNEADFNDAINKMEEVDPAAVLAFKAYNPKLFCRAFVNTSSKCDVIMSNMAETFNGYIIHARSKHLIDMLEDIRSALMQRMALKRLDMEKKSVFICPRIQERLDKEKDEAAYCSAIPSTSTSFQVNHRLDVVSVDLEARTCTCRKWTLTGIPCFHAISSIYLLNQEAESYVDEWYTKATYLKVYGGSISPVPGDRHWPKIVFPIDPPPIKIGPGRPRKNRRKHPMEDPKKKGKLTKHGMEMKCSVCKSKNHNKRKCQDKDKASTEPPTKRGRGRPKKGDPPTTHQPTITQSATHHSAVAQPSRIGRGGRVIISGHAIRGRGRGTSTAERGKGGGSSTNSRGGRRGGGRGGGRRGGRFPTGFGVLIDEAGNSYTNEPTSRNNPRLIT